MRDGERCTVLAYTVHMYIHILGGGGGIPLDRDISAIGYQVQEADSESGFRKDLGGVFLREQCWVYEGGLSTPVLSITQNMITPGEAEDHK
jgi:hypothetical protein